MKKHSFWEYYTRWPRAMGSHIMDTISSMFDYWHCDGCDKMHPGRVLHYTRVSVKGMLIRVSNHCSKHYKDGDELING